MYRILISGYYGFNNIGDESILRAVTDSLREGLSNIEITVLSHDPEDTKAKYNVNACQRKSIPAVIRALLRADLLISGGGSLLQDVTSKKSILYYLFIMWLARLFHKDYFIYSQGIGPINSQFNRRLTRRILSRAAGIVVRDEFSKEFLAELGIDEERVVVTADPVLRMKPSELAAGREILAQEGCRFTELLAGGTAGGGRVVGIAIKERKADSAFLHEMTEAVRRLITERGCRVVLIPFHFSEDMEPCEAIERSLEACGLSDSVCAIKHKYLSNEMLSIIGNMDMLVGVRLHSLIHAAIMCVPMIGISYDPKVNSFMNSMGLKAMCSIYDFKSEYLLEEFDRTEAGREDILAQIAENVELLRTKLDTNEEMIKNLKENCR